MPTCYEIDRDGEGCARLHFNTDLRLGVLKDFTKDRAVNRLATAMEQAPAMVDVLRDLEAQCQKWSPTIDRSRARAILAAIDKA